LTGYPTDNNQNGDLSLRYICYLSRILGFVFFSIDSSEEMRLGKTFNIK
jgi:hypothetical protein